MTKFVVLFVFGSFAISTAQALGVCPENNECVPYVYSDWCFIIAPTPCSPNPPICAEFGTEHGTFWGLRSYEQVTEWHVNAWMTCGADGGYSSAVVNGPVGPETFSNQNAFEQPTERMQYWDFTGYTSLGGHEDVQSNFIALRFPSCPTGFHHFENNNDLCARQIPNIDPKNLGCCNSSGGGPLLGNPINGGIGNKIETENDYLGSGAFPLKFSRTYNSAYGPYASSIGGYWVTNFDRRIIPRDSSGHFLVTRGDGKAYNFLLVDNVGVSDDDVADRLIRIVDGVGEVIGWQYTSENDEVEIYNSEGKLQSIQNRAGLTQLLVYSDATTPNLIAPYPGLLIAVTDSSGRSLSFTYDSMSRIASMVDPGGNVTTYTYTFGDHPNLVSRAYQNSVVKTYVYNEQAYTSGINLPYALTGIVDDNQARFATFGYDSGGRAVSTEHAGGVGKVSLSYSGATTIAIDALGAQRTYVSTNLFNVVKPATITEPCPSCAGGTFAHTNTYDAHGYPDQTTDLDGVVTDHDYNARGLETQRIEAKTIAGGATPAEKRTIQTDWHPDFRVPTERRTLNASGALEARTQWAYNTRGQATARCEIDPADTLAMSYTCSATIAPPTGAKVRRTVTSYCEPSDVTAGTCPLVGLVTSVNGPRATSDAGMGGYDDTTTYTYYQTDDPTCATGGACPHRHGDLWKVTNALGQVTETVSYDKNGRVTRSKDANGTLTDFTYHPRGWLTDRIVRADASGSASANDATLHIDYDPVGNVVKVTQPDGDYLAYTYDDAHRLIKIADNLNDTIDYCPGGVGSAQCLDAAGNRRVEQVKDASGNIKRQLHRVYNQLGQLTQQLNAANDPVETSAGLSESLTGQPAVADGYDGNGNRVLSDDGLGTRTKQQYDGLNRLVATIQNYNGTDTATADTTTHYTYDARDNLRQVTDPDGLNTVYDYDGLNNLTGLHSPDTGDTSYTYDKAGNRVTQTDARGVTSTYTYDALNRLTGIAYPISGLNVSYIYDQPDTTTGCGGSYPLGRLTRMIDPTGYTTYCYDRRGNVTKKTQVGTQIASCLSFTPGCGGGASSFAAGAGWGEVGVGNPTKSTAITLVTAMAYTKGDRIQSITYPSGAIITYGRDTLGRVTSVQYKANAGATAVNLVGSASYYPFGPLHTLTWGNGRTLTKSYDADYAIDSINANPAGLTLDATTDVMGNITALSQTLNPVTPDRTYQYDPLYRLSSAAEGTTTHESYTYGPTGDRMSATLDGTTLAYTYTAGTHHLASVDGEPRTYDANGNTTSGNLGYDQRNRLSGWQLAIGGQINLGGDSAKYGYNGKGERTFKQVTYNDHCDELGCIPGPGQPTGWLTGTETFAYDEAGHLIGEYPGKYGPGTNTEYVYLDSMPIAAIRGGQLYEIETDHLGTSRAIVKPGATPTADVTMWTWNLLGNTFGNDAPNEAPGGGTAFTFNLRYPGQYFDAETGLNYNYFRDYDSATGRYIESDPAGLRGGINSYSYAASRLLKFIDPTGLTFDDVVHTFFQVTASFPDLHPAGGIMCAALPDRNGDPRDGHTISYSAGDFVFAPNSFPHLVQDGTIQVNEKYCQIKCIKRSEWEDLFFTIFHEAMHSTDPWNRPYMGDDHHQGIHQREGFERNRTRRSPVPKGPMWGTPLPSPIDLDRLWDEFQHNSGECCGG